MRANKLETASRDCWLVWLPHDFLYVCTCTCTMYMLVCLCSMGVYTCTCGSRFPSFLLFLYNYLSYVVCYTRVFMHKYICIHVHVVAKDVSLHRHWYTVVISLHGYIHVCVQASSTSPSIPHLCELVSHHVADSPGLVLSGRIENGHDQPVSVCMVHQAGNGTACLCSQQADRVLHTHVHTHTHTHTQIQVSQKKSTQHSVSP